MYENDHFNQAQAEFKKVLNGQSKQAQAEFKKVLNGQFKHAAQKKGERKGKIKGESQEVVKMVLKVVRSVQMCLMAQMKAYTMPMKNCTPVSLFIHLAKLILT